MKPNILIVDDHKMYRAALRDILASDPNIGIVGEAADGVEALARASETVPDVVCMDITMPCMNGIEATRRLVAVHPGVKVIAVSTHSIKEYILEMLKVGATGYISKDEVGEHLLPAIRAVLKQQTYLCRWSQQRLRTRPMLTLAKRHSSRLRWTHEKMRGHRASSWVPRA